MKRLVSFLCISIALAGPAHATGELICETASGAPTTISLGFGHAQVSTGMWASMRVEGHWEKMVVVQSWLDRERLLVDLTDETRDQLFARIDARWNDETHSFDGTLRQGETVRWVRCRG
ncbi:hypothetical protein [Sphingomicrobium nitratireducens]|uniref:hypothetical protein n=1 Tax=Sphingomicrobium nitratireducens TaxID=2964666 RepID=UPI0022401C2D|nr:hypothetical protein [Sphingomicrobium nitratireducens]